MLFEEENLIPTKKERILQIYIEQLINDLYRNEKIEVDSKKILELLSYLTSNENIPIEMKTAIEYQNRKITDILHKKEVEQLKKYIKYLKQNSAEIAEKSAEKSAEIEKYKDLYNKALADLVKVEKKNMQKGKQRDLMLKYINYLSDELVQATGRNELEFCNGNSCKDSDYSCEKCIKQYYERKVKDEN